MRRPVLTCQWAHASALLCLMAQSCGVQVTQPNMTGLAIFQRTAAGRSHHCLDVCLRPGVLRTATVSIYINQMFTWCAQSPAVLEPMV